MIFSIRIMNYLPLWSVLSWTRPSFKFLSTETKHPELENDLGKIREVILLTDCAVSGIFVFFCFQASLFRSNLWVSLVLILNELFHFCHVSTLYNVKNRCCTSIKVEEQLVILLFDPICYTGPFSCSSLSKSLALDLSSLHNGCCTFCSHHI